VEVICGIMFVFQLVLEIKNWICHSEVHFLKAFRNNWFIGFLFHIFLENICRENINVVWYMISYELLHVHTKCEVFHV